jgi:hypothetical protein
MINAPNSPYCLAPETKTFANLISLTKACSEKKLAIRLDHYVSLFVICLFCHVGYAQGYEGLNELEGGKIKTHFSAGAAHKAERMAAQLDQVIAFYDQHLGFTPSVTLLVLSQKDWSNYTTFPVYGMPHYTDDNVLIVASEDNEYWKSMIARQDQMPEKYWKEFVQVYTNREGDLTMEPFFDLLVIHELGHAYHNQGGLMMQRKWMGELFCNILLHSYIAENEPTLLDALTGFPEMVVATTEKSALKYTSLEELESDYDHIGQNYPQNYGWYQCRWHVAAANIYNKSKMRGIKNLWHTLKEQKEILNDGAFVETLRTKVHESVAAVPLRWNESE